MNIEPQHPDDRMEYLARSLAGLPTREQRGAMMAEIKRQYGVPVARKIRERGLALLRAGYRHRRIETPASRATDSDSSYEAEAEINCNGRRAANRAIVISTVALFPGCTSRELTQHCNLSRVEIARRLPECVPDDVMKGEPRRCAIGGRKATTWWSVSRH